MINSFSQYLVEEEKTVYFTFGRMNPPTIGHEKLLDKLSSVAGRNPYKIFLSQTNDPKINPLQYKDKIKHVRKMFPKHARNILINTKIKNPFDALSFLYDQGYRKVVMVAGSDRVDEYKTRLNGYNGKDGKHGFYNFKGGIQIVSAGQRDPDSAGAEGASGTKQREYAKSNNFSKFSLGLTSKMSNADAKKLFNDVRKGLGLKEETEFKNHVRLEPVSDLREKFAEGSLFYIGEKVIIKSTDDVATISTIGSNYLIVETSEKTSRVWIDAVEKIQERQETVVEDKKSEDPDIGYRKGSQPKGYHAGIKSKSTKIARDQHFKKNAKKSDDDPSAYKKAPGDASAKTKPSRHTKRFAQMFGGKDEAIDYIDKTNDRIEREKRADKIKHDRMKDRARVLATRQKNRATK